MSLEGGLEDVEESLLQPRDFRFQSIDFLILFFDASQQRRNRFRDQLANIVFRENFGHATFITNTHRYRDTNFLKSVKGYNDRHGNPFPAKGDFFSGLQTTANAHHTAL